VNPATIQEPAKTESYASSYLTNNPMIAYASM